ncbi:hypothetical protein MMPV_000995 [Pyropia vietnamensis]
MAVVMGRATVSPMDTTGMEESDVPLGDDAEAAMDAALAEGGNSAVDGSLADEDGHGDAAMDAALAAATDWGDAARGGIPSGPPPPLPLAKTTKTTLETPPLTPGLAAVPFSLFTAGLDDMRSARGVHATVAALGRLWGSIVAAAREGNTRATAEAGGGLDVAPADAATCGAVRAGAAVTGAGTGDDVVNGAPNDDVPPIRRLAWQDVYLLARLLVPDLDTDRGAYGLRERSIADAYVRAMGLQPDAPDAVRLLRWNQPEALDGGGGGGGHLPTAVVRVLDGRCPAVGSLTLGDVERLLQTLVSNARAAGRWTRRGGSGGGGEGGAAARVGGAGIPAVAAAADARGAVFGELLRRATASENEWLVQILLSKLVLGVSSQSVLHFLDPGRAARHFASVSSLRVVVRDCANPSFAVHRQRVRLLLPARPMRAAPPTGAAPLREVLATLTDAAGYALVEPKFDGYRLQLHVAGGGSTMRCFYRSGLDCTETFGRLLGRLMPRLNAEEVVLDGEVLMWDTADGAPLPFRSIRPALTELQNALELRERGGVDDGYVRHDAPLRAADLMDGSGRGVSGGGNGVGGAGAGDDSGRARSAQLPYKLMFMVFDILYYKPRRQSAAAVAAVPAAAYSRSGAAMDHHIPLSKHPAPPDADLVLTLALEQRLELLSSVLGKSKLITPDGAVGILRVTREEARGAEAPAQAVAAMWRFVEAGFEGAVAKNPMGCYMLDGRDARLSVKLKPDFFEGGVPDLDVLILGANFGMGLSRTGNSRAGRPSTFVVGVAMEEPRSSGRNWAVNDPASHPTRFRIIGRVGAGYSYLQLEELQELLAPHWQPFDRQCAPACFADFAGTAMRGPDVPQVWIPPEHSCILTVKCYSLSDVSMNMRFPRVVRIRHDKAWYEAMTWGELVLCKNETTAPPPPDKIMLLAQGRTTRKKVSKGAAATSATVDIAKVGRRSVAPAFRSAELSEVAVTSDLFAGMTFRVVAEASAKHALERVIHAAGGELRQNMDPDVTYMVATSVSDVTVAAWVRLCTAADGGDAAASTDVIGVGGSQGPQLISPWPADSESGGSFRGVAAVGGTPPLGSQGGFPPPASDSRLRLGSGRRLTARTVTAAGGPRAVVRDTYITGCVAAGRRLPLTAPSLLYAPPDVAAAVAAVADIVGDPWWEPTTAASLAAALPAVAAAVDADPSLLAPLAADPPAVAEADLAAAAGLVFVGVVVAVPGGGGGGVGDGGPAPWAGVPGYPPPTLPAALKVAAYGGEVRWLPPAGGDPAPAAPVTHVLVHTRRVWRDGGAAASAAAAPLPVVSERWVDACVAHRRRLPHFV